MAIGCEYPRASTQTRFHDLVESATVSDCEADAVWVHEQLAELCTALVLAMRKDASRKPCPWTDATGVAMLHPERCKRGYFWVLVAPGLHVLFQVSP